MCYRNIDAMWGQLTEDALNKELAARRLQPMIMYQAQDGSSGGPPQGGSVVGGVLGGVFAVGALIFGYSYVKAHMYKRDDKPKGPKGPIAQGKVSSFRLPPGMCMWR